MPLLDEIAAYIIANVPGHALGTTLFMGTMPDTPNVCTAIFEYGGPQPNDGFGNVGLRDETPGLQVNTRGNGYDYAASKARMDAIYKALPKIQGMILSGTKYRMVQPVQTPFPQPRDSTNRVIFTCNFYCEKEMSA